MSEPKVNRATVIEWLDANEIEVTHTQLAGLFSSAIEAAQAQEDAGGWMRDGALLYRLTDECRPTNFDEIRVTMANGSRDIDKTSSLAERLLVMLAAPQPAAQPLHVAATSCPHEIDKDKIVLHFDSKQPGKNALAQLAARLQAAQAQPVAMPAAQALDSVRVFWQQHTQADALSMTMTELHADVELVIRAARGAAQAAPVDATKLPSPANVGTAPKCLNLNDQAMWVLGWNECLDAAIAVQQGGAT